MEQASKQLRTRLGARWQRGRAYEASGDLPAARREYESIIAQHGAHVPARLRLSRFEQGADRYVAARQHVFAAADAIRLDGSTRYISHVTLRLLDFAEETEAASVILSSNWNDPEIRRQGAILAQHLSLCGRYEDCLRMIDAVSPASGDARLSLIRGDALRALGAMDAAEAAYEMTVTQQPGLVDAYWALAKLGGGDPEKRAARLRAVRARLPLDCVERVVANYALFRELDRIGGGDEAWEALAEGAALMRAELRYARDAVTARVHGAMDSWDTPDAHAGTVAQPAQQPRMVFIVGLPRTGTTVLDRILGNHGWVSSAGERNDFAAAVSEVSDHFFRNLAEENASERLRALDWRKVGYAYIQRLRRHVSATALAIDKNPSNLFNIPLILRALPHARILCLQRDRMDAAFSGLKELFHGSAYAYSYGFEDLAAQVCDAEAWARHWAHAAPHAVRLVGYERLVSDPESEIATLLEFIDLPAREGLHRIEQNLAPVATASSAQVRVPINARGIGAWRRYARQLEPLRVLLQDAQ